MPKGFLKNYKSSKIKLFLFFLFIAMIFWVLTKFSREFTSTMSAKVNYENVPKTAVLSENNVRKITFDLTANGFEILFYKFKKPSLNIQVGKYYSTDNNDFTISKSELMRLVTSSFNRNLAIKNLSVEQLVVHLDPIILKKVKVIAKTDITFKNGFKATDSIQIIPDSVTISGPSESLKDITFIETNLITLKNVEHKITETVKIEGPSKGIVAIDPQKVNVKLGVAEFSQAQMSLPVEVVNLPPDVNIKLVQPTVTVSFDVSVRDFSKISKDDFRVVCDYSQRNKEENFMLPTLEKKPKTASNFDFDPKKVDFLLFK